MSDLIDRKMAIDVACKVCEVPNIYKCKGRNTTFEWCEEIRKLLDLPTAEPPSERGGRMTINLIDARRGLYDKCLELFADKNIAEKIYRYLCDGIEDCEEAEPIKHGKWMEHHGPFSWMGYITWTCSECDYEVGYEKDIKNTTNYCPHCGAKMEVTK